MKIMNRTALGAAGLLLALSPLPAAARTYSDNPAVGAHLIEQPECRGLHTRYEVRLVNQMPKARRFHAVTTVKGLRMSDVRYRIPGRTRVGVILDVPSGRELRITVRFRGEVILDRHLAGICHY